MTIRLYAGETNIQVDPKINGHRFEFWIPVNQAKWYSIWLKAASAQGDRIAYHRIGTDKLRQSAINGVKLRLRSPTRDVQVKVVEKGQLVAGVTVKAGFNYSIELRTRTNADGIAHFGLLPDQKLVDLMAWTVAFRFGGSKWKNRRTTLFRCGRSQIEFRTHARPDHE